MTPLKPVTPGARWALGISFFVLFTAVWAAVTLGGVVPKTFLADPFTMVGSGWTLLTKMGFGWDIGMTVWRVAGGFVIFADGASGRLFRTSLSGGVARPITPAFGFAASPCVSPDGRYVCYVHHDEAGVDRLAVVDAEGRGWPAVLADMIEVQPGTSEPPRMKWS